MEKERLLQIRQDLKELQKQLLLAKMTKDGRRREKEIREARLSISNYAFHLPEEVIGYLSVKVAINPLSYQYVDSDMALCIKALDDWIESM